MTTSDLPPDHYKHFQKWLRYYLNFCQKYQHSYADENSLLLSLDKLQQKNQPAVQRTKAQKAVRLYYSRLGWEIDLLTGIVQNSVAEAGRLFDLEQPTSPSTVAMDSLKNEITVRHYSQKTWKAYLLWAQKFRYYFREKPPDTVNTDDFKEFLIVLAVRKNGVCLFPEPGV